jgi:hypothetical protein
MKNEVSQNTNTASELFVASQLSRLGYAVTITFGSTKVIDLMVAHSDGRMISIDVKGLKNKTNWPLTLKLKSKTHFFVLVSYLNKFRELTENPEVFVIPSIEIEKVLGAWSGNRSVTAVSYSKVKNSKYKDAWHLIFNEKPADL